MPKSKETWDLYDKDLNHRGTFIRGNGRIPDHLYHKTVEVIPTDMEGNLLLTRRSRFKRIGGGQLEFPSGSVLAGEREEDAALRELLEETGLKAQKIYFLQRARMKGIFRYTFLAYIPDLMTDEVKIQPEEVMGYQFANFEQWLMLLTDTQEYNQFRTGCYTPKFIETMKEMVNRYAKEKEVIIEQKRAAFTPAAGLFGMQPRHLDKSCYEEEVVTPPEAQDWEPSVEQGDDGV